MTSLTDRTLVISPNNGSIKQEITNHDVLTILLFKIFINTAFYYVSIFMPIGLLCNALLFLVFAAVDKRRPNLTNHNQHPISATFLLNASNRGRHFDNHDVNNYAVPIISVTPSSRVYYKAIAYGELGTMLFKDLWWLWLGVGWPGVLGIDPLGLANPKASSAPKWLCPLSLYLWFVHETIANNCFVLLQLERVVALYHPLRARAFLKTRPALKANVAVGLVALIAIVLCITIFGFARAQPIIPVNAVSADHADLIQNIKVECVFAGAAFWSNFSLLDYMANYIFPAFMSIACSILISVKILCRRQRLSVHVAGCNTHITASEISVGILLYMLRTIILYSVTLLIKVCFGASVLINYSKEILP